VRHGGVVARIVAGGDLVQRTGDGQEQVLPGGLTIGRSGDVMCGLHHAHGYEKRRFLGLALKPRSTVSPGLASKPVDSGFPGWASKPTAVVW
jgi:hypothetical protein